MAALIILLVLAAIGLAAWLCLRRPAAPPPKVGDTPPAQDARAAEVKADQDARASEARAVTAADARLAEQRKREGIDRANEWLRKRRGGALALLVFLLPALARAECLCVRDEAGRCVEGQPATCDPEDINDLIDGIDQAEHDRNVEAAGRQRAEEELVAARARIVALEAAPAPCPPPPPDTRWKWLAGGSALGAALVLLLVIPRR